MNDNQQTSTSTAPPGPSGKLPAAAPAHAAKSPAQPQPTGGSVREIAETIVFVVVLVLLLKTFVAEAFVIPTGSMATTLYGDQKIVTCPQCDFEFPVNCSSERDPPEGRQAEPVEGCTCPNCRYIIAFRQDQMNPSCRTGDRVMVAKFVYDLDLDQPERNDVVVFKFPQAPQKNSAPLNYIKRLIGRPSETIAIYAGDIYVHTGEDDAPLTYPGRPRPEKPENLWQHEYMYVNDDDAVDRFSKGKFQIARKSPSKVMTLRRPVFDNDFQPKDLVKASFPPRWSPELEDADNKSESYLRKRERAAKAETWTAIDGNGFRHPQRKGELAWLRYRHLVVERSANTGLGDKQPSQVRPELITDLLGYDTWRTNWGTHNIPPPNWVGDLMLECEVTLDKLQGEESQKELVLELARGPDRFRVVWDVVRGDCNLIRVRGRDPYKLDYRQTNVKAPGTYKLRFANVDRRLMVWVDGSLVFGEGLDYDETAERGPTANDLEPASIGVRGTGASVKKLKLWRDTYYTVSAGNSDARHSAEDWSDPERWSGLRELPVATMYVQPGHFLCMGDNSPESSDGRNWGLVPRRLLLGRALAVYFPILRIGPIQ